MKLCEIPTSHRPFGTAGPSVSYLTSLLPQVSATDEDRGSFGTISYTLGSASGSSAPTLFTIDKESGQLCTRTALDRDDGSDKFDLTVTATDGVSVHEAIMKRRYLFIISLFSKSCTSYSSHDYVIIWLL